MQLLLPPPLSLDQVVRLAAGSSVLQDEPFLQKAKPWPLPASWQCPLHTSPSPCRANCPTVLLVTWTGGGSKGRVYLRVKKYISPPQIRLFLFLLTFVPFECSDFQAFLHSPEGWLHLGFLRDQVSPGAGVLRKTTNIVRVMRAGAGVGLDLFPAKSIQISIWKERSHCWELCGVYEILDYASCFTEHCHLQGK